MEGGGKNRGGGGELLANSAPVLFANPLIPVC